MKQPKNNHLRQESASRSAFWSQRWFLGSLLVLLIFGAYQPVWHAGYIWDDDAYVTNNPLLTEPDGLRRIWFSAHFQSQYFPLVYTVLRFEYALWGLHPLGYHLVNVLLHSFNALLAWMILRRLAIPCAWFAAAVFALHPVQVETVAWITELKNTQSTLFYFLALLVWIEFTEKESSPRWYLYWLSLIFYLLALFSKTVACTLPAALVITLWLQKKTIDRWRVIQIIPFVITGVAMGLVSVWWERHLGNYEDRFGLSFSPIERMLIATRAIWFYLGKLAWPVNLTFSYPRWELDPRDPSKYVWVAACAAALTLLCWAWWRGKGRSIIAGFGFFVTALSPMLGFVSLFTFYFSFVADHYVYLACIGPLTLAVVGVNTIMAKLKMELRWRAAAGGAILVLLAVASWRQAGIYRDAETIWRDTLAKNPTCWMACNNLGIELQREWKLGEAEFYFRKAVAMQPDDPGAHVNLADCLMAQRKTSEAVDHYEKALRYHPKTLAVENNLGTALLEMGRVADAINLLEKAVEKSPSDASAHNNLATALRRAGREDEAMFQYQQALEIQPNFAEAHFNFGNILFQHGRLEEAERHYRAALECQPNFPEAKRNLAILLSSQQNGLP